MKAVILAGGLGTRLAEETEVRPKPMVEIGGRPILWHIMKHYAHYGFNEFVVALGYKGDVIKRYFLDYAQPATATSRSTSARGTVERARATRREDWTVHLVDTGDDDDDRRPRQAARAAGSAASTFMADLRRRRLRRRPRRAARVPPRARPASRPSPRCGRRRASAAWCSTAIASPSSPRSRRSARAGSTAASSSSSRRSSTTSTATTTSLEARRRSSGWRASGQLVAYRHDEFWQCMDTLRDKRLLEALWESGSAPWKVWHDAARSGATGPTLVTGATGLVGGWLVRRLRRARRRRRLPRARLGAAVASSSAAGCSTRVKVVRGDVRDQALLERVLGEYEIDTVFHLAAQTIVGIANRNPVSTFETNIARHLGAARGVPAQPDGRSRSWSPRRTRPTATTTQLPYDEDDAARRAAIPTTSASRAPT